MRASGFIGVRKIACVSFDFTLLRSVIHGLINSRHFPNQLEVKPKPINNNNNNNNNNNERIYIAPYPWLMALFLRVCRTRFPALGAFYVYVL